MNDENIYNIYLYIITIPNDYHSKYFGGLL